MTDIWPAEKRSAVMSLVKGRGNRSTELVLARIFRANSIKGWRRHLSLPGKPDFCFPKLKVAVFVDGCFWHGCPRCYRRPKSNTEFWDRKISGNRARDRRVARELATMGWRVVRIPEHLLAKTGLVISRIRRASGGRLGDT